MKIAIVGSRCLTDIDLDKYIRIDNGINRITEIVSGGAVGIDTRAADYAKRHGLTLTEFLPQYERYGRAAPIVRNKEIVDYADKVIVFWNGASKGTLSVIKYSEKVGKHVEVVLIK